MFHLAREQKWPSVQWGLENITSAELTDWKAYYSIYPFESFRDDLRAGIVASSIYNSQRTDKKQRVFTPKDFMYNFDKTETTQEGDVNDDVQSKFRMFKLLMSR